MIDLTPVLEALVSLVVVIITCVIVPYIRKKTSQETFDEIREWVKIAVLAAEQIYTGSGRGTEKKAYVVDFLKSKGFTIDSASVDALIESCVKELA